jgi:hypothetical protein
MILAALLQKKQQSRQNCFVHGDFDQAVNISPLWGFYIH